MLLRLRNQRGQGLIESIALSAALLGALTCLGGILYFGFVHAGMNYLLHELLICKSTQGSGDCTKTFRRQAAPLLFAAKIMKLESSVRPRSAKARLVLKMPLDRTLTLKKDLKIRL